MLELAQLAHGPLSHPDGTVTFRVWSPRAEQVSLVLADDAHEMSPMDRGWFVVRTPAAPDDRYAFRLDGGPERPDPASRRQPDGVHGRSALVDPGAWCWTDEDFRPPPLTSGAVYELHVPTFTPEGTFAAAAEHLAALRDLGITHVEVMPVNAYNGDRGWGYDGVAWYAVHEAYGGPEAFTGFVDACHGAGLAVVLDVVYNHLGPSGNYLGEFGPYLTDSYATPWGEAPNVDGPDSDPVRAFIIDNALMWLTDYHVDGLRLDAVHGIVDTSSVHLLAELTAAAGGESDRFGRELQLVAESDRQDPATVMPRTAGGLGLQAQWLDDLHHSIHTALTGESDGYYIDYNGLADVAAVYTRGFAFDGRWSEYRHRTVGAPVPDGVSSRRFVTCVQNHDQIGNRAQGERLTSLVSPARLRAGIALLCLSPTTPMLFMGDEFGATTPFLFFSGHPEPELDKAVREGRRAEFASFSSFDGEVPDPQDPATMEASRLDWSESERPEGRERRRLWTDLLELRRTAPALASGDRRKVHLEHADPEHLALVRAGPPDLLLAANLGDRTWDCTTAATGLELLWSSEDERYGGRGGGSGEPAVTVADGRVSIGAGCVALFVPEHR
jgi:maltooligosyltrehalose trehalohydrolase